MLVEFVHNDSLVSRRYVLIDGVFYVFISAGRFEIIDCPEYWINILANLNIDDAYRLDEDNLLHRVRFTLDKDLIITLFELVCDTVCNNFLGLMWSSDSIMEFCNYCHVLNLKLDGLRNILLSECYSYLNDEDYYIVVERFEAILTLKIEFISRDVNSFVRKLYKCGGLYR